MPRRVLTLEELTGIASPDEVRKKIADRFRSRRKERKLSREKLSLLSGVSYASIRRFEEMGNISLNSLLLLASKLDALSDFDALFAKKRPTNIDEVGKS